MRKTDNLIYLFCYIFSFAITIYLLTGCGTNRFEGNAGYDGLTEKEKTVYEYLWEDLSAIENGEDRYESELYAEDGLALYNAYNALKQDLEGELAFPTDIVIINQVEKRNGTIKYSVRYVFESSE